MKIKKGYHAYQSFGFVHLRVYVVDEAYDINVALAAVGQAAQKLIDELNAAGLKAELRHDPKLETLPYSRLKYEASIQVTGTEPSDQKYCILSQRQDAILDDIVRSNKGIIEI